MAVVVLLALAGIGLVLVSTAKYGAGITSLSSAYLDVASNLARGKGFVFHTGEPMVLWPPLYSLLLALVGYVTGLDPATFAHVVNAVLFALVICLSANLFRTAFRQNATYGLLGIGAVLFSVPLSLVYATAWSECLFIPLTLIFLVFAQRYWNCHGMWSLVVMTLSTALACLTRYVGVALVPVGLVAIVFASGTKLKTRLPRAVAFVTLSLAPLGLWLVRNYETAGTLTGVRGAAASSVAASAVATAGTMVSWYTFGLVSELVVLAWLAVLTVRVLSSGAPTRRLIGSLRAVFVDRLPVVLLLASYITVVLVTSGATELDQIDDRLLSPVYIPVTLLLLEVGSLLFGPTQRRTAAFVGGVPSVLLAVWLCFPLASVARTTVRRMRNGAGSFSSDIWRESETVAYARQMLSDNDRILVYSNGPDLLWTLSGVNARLGPGKTHYGSTESVSRHDDLIGRWPPEHEAYLVWFKGIRRAHLFSIEELEAIADVKEVAHFSDGSIYRVSPLDTTAPASQ